MQPAGSFVCAGYLHWLFELAPVHHHIAVMTFLSFIVFLLLAMFVLWSIWDAMRDIGETSDDDTWGD